ncbi:polysaccharide pyruvyl transferase family protein [Herbiconiux sp. YIM B11900]|uniref:polysaccharide pyruvyl transferase family protein n=1 Tax=Herbiconiux sp. YIM B11900 TaxID=3404131 RepID=UPI003F84CEC1
MAKKYILMVGVEFNNQGAYLMLLAAAERIRTQFDAVPVVEFHNGADLKKRMAGVYPLVPQRTFGLFTALTKVPLLRKIWKRFPWVLPTEIEAVFDGSGFRYGDQWVNQSLEYTAGKLAQWASRGVPVYMLPQAFGPFEKTAEPSLAAIRASRIVFARDPESESYVRGLAPAGVPRKLTRRPDFTAVLAGRFPPEHEKYRGAVPIVPNINIYSRADGEASGRYVDNLAAIVTELSEQGMRPYGLAHEGRRDIEILQRVVDRVQRESGIGLDVVSGLDGVELKGLIGSAPLLVSGRYHAVVSALSQGVPTVIHGWSHKYEHVAADFGAPELLADPLGAPEDSIRLIRQIIDSDELRPRILAAAADVKDEIEAMWSEIRHDLRSPSGR